MTKIVLCTDYEHRHRFIAHHLGKNFDDIFVFHEKKADMVKSDHLAERTRIEIETLEFNNANSYNHTVITKGEINSGVNIQKLQDMNPDIILSYGCSILSDEFIEKVPGIKLNAHLGLSPYYRGAGTNFWPIFNHEPSFCGVTYHEVTNKIDGGNIYNQRRVEKEYFPTIHHFGNSIINKIPEDLGKIVNNIHLITPVSQSSDLFNKTPRRYYKTSDFSDHHAEYVKKNFKTILDNFIQGNDEPAPVVEVS